LVLLYGCGESPQKSDQASGVVYTSEGDVIEKTQADAGDDVSVKIDETVIFDARKSTHKNADIVSYEWSIGDIVLSTNDYFEKSDFGEGEHIIVLTVVDSNGVTSTDTLVLRVSNTHINENNETVEDVITSPNLIAKAGADVNVSVNDIVVLDASESSDKEGKIVSYEWREGSTLLSITVTFSKSDFSEGVHAITLTITSDNGNRDTDKVVVNVLATEIDNNSSDEIILTNQSLIANAGEDISVREGVLVSLSASKSSGSDGSIVSYVWREGATLLSTSISFSRSDFLPGIHSITLSIRDNDGEIATDTVIINIVANGLPIAKAGSDIRRDENENLTLDASESSDSDGVIVKYEWKEESVNLTV